jgi:hypothetical protein
MIYYCVFVSIKSKGEQMNRRTAWVLSVAIALATTTLCAAEAHEHGAAKINVSVEGGEVTIELETPLDNLFGFERAPKDAAEEKAVKEAAAKLRKADALFVFPPKAECKLVSAELESEALSDELLGQAHSEHADHDEDEDHDHDSDHEGHADLDAEYVFACANPKALNRVVVDFFKVFPRTSEIEAQIVTSKGQSAAELTAKNNAIIIAR